MNKKFSISLDDEKLKKLEAVCKDQERSMNYIINKALEVYLDEVIKKTNILIEKDGK